jgi:A/G-specific adenine glycosylase
MDEHHGKFPQDFDSMQDLPGIGRSTAAAIASFAFHQIQTILDGNVKRVLSRHFVVEGWPSKPSVEKVLWSLAESLLPQQNMVAYTQGLMDLGATLCTRSKPKCHTCPLQISCAAYHEQRVHELPTPKPRKTIPEKNTTMLILLDGDEVMLEKRPPTGIWGGLWSFPEAENTIASDLALKPYKISTQAGPHLAKLSHAFTHFKLHIEPRTFHIMHRKPSVAGVVQIWLSIDDAIAAAIPTPVRKILQSLQKKLAST